MRSLSPELRMIMILYIATTIRQNTYAMKRISYDHEGSEISQLVIFGYDSLIVAKFCPPSQGFMII